MVNMQRLAKHLLLPSWWSKHIFTSATREKIEAAIKASESHHHGELRFVVETSLPLTALLRGTTARERAIDTFSQLRVWDTEQNSGILIYLLLADRDVEIIADRGIHARVGSAGWEEICQQMEQQYRQQQFEAGTLHGIKAISKLLTQHFPAAADNVNELSDTPVLI